MSVPPRSPRRESPLSPIKPRAATTKSNLYKTTSGSISPHLAAGTVSPLNPRSPLSQKVSLGDTETSEENTVLAIKRLSDLLKHPDDLNVKLDFLKKKLLQEKSSVETQLRTDVQSQFDDIQETFRILKLNQSQLVDVQNRLSKINSLCQDNHSRIPGYDTIKELSQAHSNMASTHKYVQRFRAFQQQVSLIEKLLAEVKGETGFTHRNLLAIHYELYHVEEFRDITIHYAKKCSPDVVITLNRMFRSVESVSLKFAELLWEAARNLFRWIEEDKVHLVVHIVKVVSTEEQADRRALQAELAKSHNLKRTDKTSGSRWKLAEGSPRQTKSYKARFLSVLREAIDSRLNQMLEGLTELEDVLDTLDAVPADLKLLFDTIVPAFPPDFHIADFFLAEYHGHVHRRLDSLVTEVSQLEGGQILRTMRFVQDYHDELFRHLSVSEDVLEPALLGGSQTRLVETYIALVSGKLAEWTSTMIKLDTDLFVTRAKEPQSNSDGQYYMAESGTAFQAYDQQIDIAADANSARVLVEIIKCCAKVALVYQNRLGDTLKSELDCYLDDPSSVSQGLFEYTIAFMNDQLKSVDMGEPLVAKVSGMLHDVYKERAVNYINEMSDGFFKLASQGHEVILKIIFNDLKAGFSQLYTSVWYEEDLVLCIIATFEDYCTDASQKLHPFLFDLLINKLFERFLIESLQAFTNRHAQFRIPQCASKMETESKAVQHFFSNYLDGKVVQSKLDPLVRLQSLTSASAKMVFLDFYPLRKQYPDMPISLVESIMNHRTDLDRGERREILESIRSKDSDVDFSELTEPTIFSQLQTQSHHRFLDQSMFRRVGF